MQYPIIDLLEEVGGITINGKNKLSQNNSYFLNIETEAYGANDRKVVTQLNTLSAGTYTISIKEKVTSLNNAEAVPTTLGVYLRAVNNDITLNVPCTIPNVAIVVGKVETKSTSFTLNEEYVGKFNAFYIYTGKNNQVSPEVLYTGIIYDVQLESGSTATNYEPYFSITFPQLSADDIAHRLKLPMLKYYPHAVIEALQTVKNGETLTYEQYGVLKHYLTPLGIGGI